MSCESKIISKQGVKRKKKEEKEEREGGKKKRNSPRVQFSNADHHHSWGRPAWECACLSPVTGRSPLTLANSTFRPHKPLPLLSLWIPAALCLNRGGEALGARGPERWSLGSEGLHPTSTDWHSDFMTHTKETWLSQVPCSLSGGADRSGSESARFRETLDDHHWIKVRSTCDLFWDTARKPSPQNTSPPSSANGGFGAFPVLVLITPDTAQCGPIELSSMMEISHIHAVQDSTTSHICLQSTWNVAGASEEWNFQFNLNLNSHTWLVTTASYDTDTNYNFSTLLWRCLKHKAGQEFKKCTNISTHILFEQNVLSYESLMAEEKYRAHKYHGWPTSMEDVSVRKTYEPALIKVIIANIKISTY